MPGKLIRLCLAMLAMVFVSSCVLRSNQPLFSNDDAVLALGSDIRSFDGMTRDGETWKTEKDARLSVVIEGKLYVLIDPTDAKKTATMALIPLEDDTFAVQLNDRSIDQNRPDAFVYGIGRLQDGELLFAPLLCSELSKDEKVQIIDGNYCELAASAEARESMTGWARTQTDWPMKIVALK